MFSFVKHITDHISMPKLGHEKFPTFWPSESSAVVNGEVKGSCRRKTWLRYMAALKKYYAEEAPTILTEKTLNLLTFAKDTYTPPGSSLVWIGHAGETFENFLIDKAKSSGIYAYDQVPVYIKSLNVSGKIDIVVINPFTGLYRAIEAKSVNDNTGRKIFPKSGKIGEPKDINLMQIATYVSEFCNYERDFEGGELVYGNRGSGAMVDFLIKVENDSIFYKQVEPFESKWVESNITISAIKDSWRYLQENVNLQTLPEKDFSLVYDEDQLKKAFDAGELTKAETEQFTKVISRRAENASLENEGKKKKQDLKQVVTGDKECLYCPYTLFCYDETNSPRQH